MIYNQVFRLALVLIDLLASYDCICRWLCVASVAIRQSNELKQL